MQIIDLQKKYQSIPTLNLELLLAAALHQTKEFIYTHPEYPISIIQYLRFRWFIHLYKQGYSIAVITKHKEFYGLDFFVNKNVLIPRPDTELMVAEAIEDIKYQVLSSKETLLIDIGTGSGCIPIAILKTLTNKNINTFATDISRSALRVAKKNAKKHGVKINFLHGNLLEPVLSVIPATSGNPDNSTGYWIPNLIGNDNRVIITANLPYLTEQQFQQSPSIQKEPKIALTAENNGLALYEKLLKQITSLISNIKYPISVFLEIDPSQTETIQKLIKQYLPNAITETKKDLNGLNRLVKIF
ncbi:MAG: Release factor glutamine methyltransferase [Candidatus Magasanikbacteria bacterium GW2011_GWA2_40_10]|uniref:Release factor glutamine methyltransferase n=1 Tax=Candidatus Magasanikbacteria bacterium GW2011_GWA2_40_10 TaxID=1619037 RepID=A0A0G0TAV4_9BACT|nr:MAG: Release factor glutamine methyltransferase [Candidatus Magasanikbacteria bacterium GW2011_GWA2_40_10]